MKSTKLLSIFPMNAGLDTSSIAGTQDPKKLRKASNITLRTKPSLKKRPGQRRIPYSGETAGVQGVIHWFATVNGATKDEIVRVRNGRIEVLRTVSGSEKAFIDLNVDDISPTDVVTFERFANVLIMNFENTPPKYYTMAGTVSDLPILSSHLAVPPGFSRQHDFRLWYSGRTSDRDKIWVSVINNPFNFNLNDGGFSMRVRQGDGDPKGITGLSPVFRGDLYALKWDSIHRIYRSGYGYGIDTVCEGVGGVHHNAIVGTQNDIYFISHDAWRSLAVTMKYGAAEFATVSYPIYEYFQESVNWAASRLMVMVHNKRQDTLLLSYSSASSTQNDRVLGYSLNSQQFFEWESIEYPSMCKYFDFGVQEILVADEERGLCLLDDSVNTLVNDPIRVEVETGIIFPMGAPKFDVGFTQGWLLAKPTPKSVKIDVTYRIDGGEKVTVEVDTQAGGTGGTIDPDVGGIIGTDAIGRLHKDMAVLPFKLVGNGSSIQFGWIQDPPEEDADQPCEVFGIVYEISYDDDSEQKLTS